MGEEPTGGDRRRLTVPEAATVLGVTVDAVRGRIRRGTIASEHDKDGKVYVWVDAPEAGPAPTVETVGRPPNDQSALVEELRDRVRALEEANRENRRLLAAALERIPAIEAPPDMQRSPEPRESPQTASEEPSGTQEASQGYQEEERGSWWRRLFRA
jgi:hypothetical protein